jgi:hypothetical protein
MKVQGFHWKVSQIQEVVFVYFIIVKRNKNDDDLDAIGALEKLLHNVIYSGYLDSNGNSIWYLEILRSDIPKLAKEIDNLHSEGDDIISLLGGQFEARDFKVVENRTKPDYIPFKDWSKFDPKQPGQQIDPNECPKCGGKGQVASCGCRCLDCGYIIWG